MFDYFKRAVEEALKEDAPEKAAPTGGKYEIASFKLYFMAPPIKTIVKPGEELPKKLTLEKGESINRNFQWRFFRFLFSIKGSKDLKYYVFHMELEPSGTQRSVKVFDSDSDFSVINAKIQSKDIAPQEVMKDPEIIKLGIKDGKPAKRPMELKSFGVATYINLDPKDSGNKSSGKSYSAEEFEKDFINAAFVLFDANAGAPPVNAFGDPISVTTVPKKAPKPEKAPEPGAPATTPEKAPVAPKPGAPGPVKPAGPEPVNPLLQKESAMSDQEKTFIAAVKAAQDKKMAKPFSGGFDIMEKLVKKQRKDQKEPSKD
jgi:hypothetical protein